MTFSSTIILMSAELQQENPGSLALFQMEREYCANIKIKIKITDLCTTLQSRDGSTVQGAISTLPCLFVRGILLELSGTFIHRVSRATWVIVTELRSCSRDSELFITGHLQGKMLIIKYVTIYRTKSMAIHTK